jgi:DNA-binding transcriptional ArsR family regulator
MSLITDRVVSYMLDNSYNDISIHGLCQARISRQATKSHNSLNNNTLTLIAERFRVLGDPLRLQLFHLLGDSEMSVGALVEATGASQANVSKHLQILLRVGLVQRRKEGLQAYYKIADPSVFQLCDLVCGRLSEQFQADLSAIGMMRHRGQ